MWICDKCGREIPAEYEICMYCGNVRTQGKKSGAGALFNKVKPVAAALAAWLKTLPARLKRLWARLKPLFAKLKPLVRKFASNKKALIASAAGLAVLLIVLMSVSLSFHGKAKASFELGNYQESIEYAKKDFLFGSRLRKDAIRALGDRYMAKKNYAAAAEQYALLGKSGHEAWSEAIFSLAECQMDDGLYTKALENYRLIEDEERGREGKNYALYMCALECIWNRDYDSVSGYVEQMDGDYAEIYEADALYTEIDFRKATDLLIAGDYSGAIKGYEDCLSYGSTPKTLQAVRQLQQGKYYESACAAKANAGYDWGQLSDYDWAQVYDNARNSCPSGNVEERLNANAAYSVFAGERQDIYRGDISSIQFCFPEEGIPSGLESAVGYDRCTPVDKTIMLESGSAPKGKVLILWQAHNYLNKQTEYAVAWDLMDYLPEELYPQDLASVEFVIRTGYDHQVDGWYTFNDIGDITAITEYAKVVAEQSASRKQLYAAYTVWGDEAPDTVYSSQITDGYISGGAPHREVMAQTVLEAINIVIRNKTAD